MLPNRLQLLEKNRKMKLSRSEKSFFLFMHGQKELWSCGFHRNPERDYPDNSCLPLCVVNNWTTVGEEKKIPIIIPNLAPPLDPY